MGKTSYAGGRRQYRLEPGRIKQLCSRFGVPLPQNGQNGKTVNGNKTGAEKPRSEPKTGDSTVSAVSTVLWDMPADNDTKQSTGDPESDTSDEDERAAIMADEAPGADALWADLAALPAMVLDDRASRTDDPEIKRRLLALAREKRKEDGQVDTAEGEA